MEIHRIPLDQALAGLRAERGGLATAEAERRLAEFGPNEVARVRREPWLHRLGKEFVHFFALILWVAAGLAFYVGRKDPEGGMAGMGWAIVGVILINGLFSFWQEARAERAIQALERLLPDRVKVLRDGVVAELPARLLAPGDVVLLEAGDRVPADGRILEAFSVQVSAATLTGESVPVARGTSETSEADPVHATNLLLAGTALTEGEARMVVYATGMRTQLGRIAQLTQADRGQASPLQREIARVSRFIAAFATALGVLFFLLGRQLHLSVWQDLVFAIGIIVANVPEGLLPTVTLALAMAAQRMAKRNALVRRLPAVEALGEATVICTDKTGTLTLNRMAVVQAWLDGSWIPARELRVEGHETFFRGAAHAHGLKRKPGGEGPREDAWLGDPMEVALVECAIIAGEAGPEPPRLDCLPFDAVRRRLSVAHAGPGTDRRLLTKGAPEFLLPLCTRAWMEGRAVPLDEALRGRVREALESAADRGLRVIAFAARDLPPDCPRERLEEDLTFTGLAALEDPPRPEVAEAVRTCRAARIRILMVTGDHPRTAEAIARQIGLVEGEAVRVITGEALRRLTDTELQLALDHPELVFARLDPDQKTRIVLALQRKGEVVAVTGDGVNDAPALKAADIGVAMGRSGTDVAREASDLVLADDNFASIVSAVEEGRAVFDNLRKFLTYHMTSNCAELLPFIAFVALGVPLPLTVLQILVIDLGTDQLPALALGAERPEPGIMDRPPRGRVEPLLTARVFLRAYGTLGLFEALSGLSAFFATLVLGGWSWGQALDLAHPLALQASAACLSGIIAGQMVAVFLCRSEHRSLFAGRLRPGRLLLVGLATEALVLLAINRGPALLSGLAIPPRAWLAMLPWLLGMVVAEEVRKALVRRLPASG
ncbi:MAG: cation-transporting P-type ATPase [Holophagaceae bacterium]